VFLIFWGSWSHLQKHVGKVWIGEFEMSFVIEFEECWTVGVMFLEMEVMYLWLIGCVPTFFTHVHLWGRSFEMSQLSIPFTFTWIDTQYHFLGLRFQKLRIFAHFNPFLTNFMGHCWIFYTGSQIMFDMYCRSRFDCVRTCLDINSWIFMLYQWSMNAFICW
jgi:hypothetical protein